tara:strand:- start:254 stop:862 length:609 start_codon:yes stop_codon:yes gene_type:complete
MQHEEYLMLYRFSKNLMTSALIAVPLAAGAVPAMAAEYKLDPAHSFIVFKIKHLGFSWLVGRFNSFDGTIEYDPETGPESQSISVTIDAASLDTNHAERDKHLRSDDFFNVSEYPTVTFESTGYEGDETGGTLSGELTFLGVTKPISFEVRKVGEGADPWGGYRAGFEGSYTMTRGDFGMDYDLGPASRTVEIDLYVEGIRQ